MDTVNFSFWPDEGDVKYGVKDKHGKFRSLIPSKLPDLFTNFN